MTILRCHQCGYTAKKVGSCPKCNIALHRKCGVCGMEIEFCTCTSIIAQTKGHRQK